MFPVILDDIIFGISAVAVIAAFAFSQAGAAPLLPSQQRVLPQETSTLTDQGGAPAVSGPDASAAQRSAAPATVPGASAIPEGPLPRERGELFEGREEDD